MAYGDFTLEGVCRSFDLQLIEHQNLFGDVTETAPSVQLRTLLDDYVPLATSIHTEKARSEFIVAPILAEVRKRKNYQVSLFSGIAFDVDKEKGLSGFCDFLLSRSPVQLFLQAPIMSIVEAKNDDIKAGLGQCVAEMVAARIFNLRAGQEPSTIFGAVTTGSLWRFLKLSESLVFVDRIEYYLDDLDKILGILLGCVEPVGPSTSATDLGPV